MATSVDTIYYHGCAPFFDDGFRSEIEMYKLWEENARLTYENVMLRQESLAFAYAGWQQDAVSAASLDSTYADSDISTAAATSLPGSLDDDEMRGGLGLKVQMPGTLPFQMHASVMMRNLPNCYTREMLLDLLDAEGYTGSFDFFYLPIDFRRGLSLGYAFINFTSPSMAEGFRIHFTGFTEWSVPSDKVCQVIWSDTLQGLDAHIKRYRNSPVMHESVPDGHKPMTLAGSMRVPFPPPTKKIRAPRLWHIGRKHDEEGC